MKDDVGLTLNYMQKLVALDTKKLDKEIYEYIKDRLSNLYIEIGLNDADLILNLMDSEKLHGWCFESTESAIVFFNDYDYIERGYLFLDDFNRNYYHSWICFKYNNKEYVFDPCLSVIATKHDYQTYFRPRVISQISAKLVKKEFLKQLRDYQIPQEKNSDDYKERRRIEAKLQSIENPNYPIYRNSASYIAEVEDDKIKKINVRYNDYK